METKFSRIVFVPAALPPTSLAMLPFLRTKMLMFPGIQFILCISASIFSFSYCRFYKQYHLLLIQLMS